MLVAQPTEKDICSIWTLNEGGYRKELVACDVDAKMAEDLVRAYNCHDELLAACELAAGIVEEWAPSLSAPDQLRAAIAKARGEE